MNLLQQLEREQVERLAASRPVPEFQPGDTLRVGVRVVEGERERIQVFEGDVIRGNQTLFMRRDEVEAAWQWIDPILDLWKASPETPKPYTSGTWGPSAAVALIERDGRTWYEDDGK